MSNDSDSAPSGEPMVRGHAMLSYVTPLRARPEMWSSISSHLRPAALMTLERELNTIQWYPRTLLDELLDAMQRAWPGDETRFRELGVWAAREQINSVYRLFLSFTTPAMVFRRAGSLWRRQSSAGTFRVIEDADDHLVGELVDRGLHRGMLSVVAGWSDEVIRMLRRTPYPTKVSRQRPDVYHFLVSWQK